MKKTFLFCLLAMMAVWTNNMQAQFLSIGKWISTYYPGVLYYNDGHSEEYRWVEMPKGSDKNITVFSDEKKKNKLKIPSQDLHHISFWTVKNPDKKYALFHIRAKGLGHNIEDLWGYAEAASSWGIVVSICEYYSISGKGDLVGHLTSSNMGTMQMMSDMPSYLYRWGDELAQLLMINGKIRAVNITSQYFHENPEIAEGIKSKKLKAKDLQYILDEMAGGAQTANEDKAPHEGSASQVKIEEANNGSIGDDE